MTDWVDDIDRRTNRATPGPWRSYIEGRDFWGGSNVIVTSGDDIESLCANAADQDFIAHARQDIPCLVDEIWRLRYSLSWARNPLSPLRPEDVSALIFYPTKADDWVDEILARIELTVLGTIDVSGLSEMDQEFIVHAHGDTLRLIAELRRLQRIFNASAAH